MLELERREKDKRCAKSFAHFVRSAWPYVEPNDALDWNWHLDAKCVHLQAVSAGKIQNLIINEPPGYAKPCEENGTVVERSRGLIPLREVVPGDYLLTHRGRFRRVSAIHKQGVLSLYEIRTHSRRCVRVAGDHPLLTARGWIAAQNITTDDVLAEVLPQESCGSRTITNEEARLLGYLVGDGSVKYQETLFTNVDEDILTDFRYCAESLGWHVREKQQPPSRTRKMLARQLVINPLPTGGRWYQSTRGRNPVKVWLELHGLLGKCSYDKRVPKSVMSGDDEVVSQYLAAYWSCDGHISDRRDIPRIGRPEGQTEQAVRVGCDTISEGLARDHHALLNKLGLSFTLRHKVSKLTSAMTADGARVGMDYVSWFLHAQDQDTAAKLMAILMPRIYGAKRNKREVPRTGFDRVLVPDKVVSIEQRGKGACRCLSVDEDCSFSYQGLAVHNSLVVSVLWVAWEWGPGARPELRWMASSYSSDLSIRDSIKCRNLVESDWYQNLWGDRVRLVKRNETRLETAAGGFRIASSTGGLSTGERVHRAIHDDLLRANDEHSRAMREQAIQHLRAMATRSVTPEDYRQVLIMQRLHEEDPTGWLLKERPGRWDHLRLRAAYEGQDKPTSIGWVDPRKKEGEPLWPSRYPKEKNAELAADLGEWRAAGQLQQNPQPVGGGILKRKWWREWPKDKKLPVCDHVFCSWDTAYSEEDLKENSCSAMTEWGIFYNEFFRDGRGGHNVILLSAWDGRVEYPDLKQRALDIDRDRAPDRHLIEKKASGQSLIQDMRRARIRVYRYNPDRDKVARAYAVQSPMQQGVVWYPEGKAWATKVIEACASFPFGGPPSSDYTDTVTQAILYLRNGWWIEMQDDPEDEEIPQPKVRRLYG